MYFPDRNAERMMDMWMDLLSQIENDESQTTWRQRGGGGGGGGGVGV